MNQRNQDEFIPSQEHTTSRATIRDSIKSMSYVQLGILLLAGAYTLYFIRPVLLPIILALLLSLVLKPVHRFFVKTFHLPAPIVAVFIMVAFVSSIGYGIYQIGTPAIEYTEKLRNDIVKNRLKNVFQPFSQFQTEVSQVAQEVQKITTPKNDPSRSKVEVETPAPFLIRKPDIQDKPKVLEAEELTAPVEPTEKSTPPVNVKISQNPIEDIYLLGKELFYHTIITLTLLFFLLAYGEKMIKRITEVDATADLMEELTIEVSKYMLTITLINIGLGVITGLAMWYLGMPNPILWGVMATTLNFIPYIGAIIGAIIVFLVAATTFDNTLTVGLIPSVYYGITVLEGNFITPAILGKSFTVNPIVIFIWVLAWGALWGIPGMLIGLPILMVFRIICSKFPAFERIERIISS